jgi:hypothetical protein
MSDRQQQQDEIIKSIVDEITEKNEHLTENILSKINKDERLTKLDEETRIKVGIELLRKKYDGIFD